MPKVTLSIPRELKDKLDKYPEVNWTEVLRSGIKEKIEKLNKFEKLEGRI
ncbi:MAG: hypothetical protein V1859_06680 [archaeon]